MPVAEHFGPFIWWKASPNCSHVTGSRNLTSFRSIFPRNWRASQEPVHVRFNYLSAAAWAADALSFSFVAPVIKTFQAPFDEGKPNIFPCRRKGLSGGEITFVAWVATMDHRVRCCERDGERKQNSTDFLPVEATALLRTSQPCSDSAPHPVTHDFPDKPTTANDLPATLEAIIQRLLAASVAYIARKRRAFLQDASFPARMAIPLFGSRVATRE